MKPGADAIEIVARAAPAYGGLKLLRVSSVRLSGGTAILQSSNPVSGTEATRPSLQFEMAIQRAGPPAELAEAN